jgi:hypothetical protein
MIAFPLCLMLQDIRNSPHGHSTLRKLPFRQRSEKRLHFKTSLSFIFFMLNRPCGPVLCLRTVPPKIISVSDTVASLCNAGPGPGPITRSCCVQVLSVELHDFVELGADLVSSASQLEHFPSGQRPCRSLGGLPGRRRRRRRIRVWRLGGPPGPVGRT